MKSLHWEVVFHQVERLLNCLQFMVTCKVSCQKIVHENINKNFPGQWIGTAGSKLWLLWSPDLTPQHLLMGPSKTSDVKTKNQWHIIRNEESETQLRLQKFSFVCGKNGSTKWTCAKQHMGITVNFTNTGEFSVSPSCF
jgi:hypothetical protein